MSGPSDAVQRSAVPTSSQTVRTDAASRVAPVQVRPALKAPPPIPQRAYTDNRRLATRPYQTADRRFHHPHPWHVRALPHHPIPGHAWYRPWYTHWWVHPHYRWIHPVHVFVHFDFRPDPWGAVWVPPARAGWVWVHGHYVGSTWVPGHWKPVAAAPAWYGARWVFVPGFWVGTAYVEGYWRNEARNDWVWVDGYYLQDGSYIPGYWMPSGPAPAGYTWEPGFWDGEQWVEGYWRPVSRSGYVWVNAHYNPDGTFEAGYWEPVEKREGYIWIPGWFDGSAWVPGYWITQSEYDATDPQSWTPPEGYNDGWDDVPTAPSTEPTEGDIPLALPADME